MLGLNSNFCLEINGGIPKGRRVKNKFNSMKHLNSYPFPLLRGYHRKMGMKHGELTRNNDDDDDDDDKYIYINQ